MAEEPEIIGALVGATLDGRYRLEAFIADGGYGTVYRSTHDALGCPVAIKVLTAPAYLDGGAPRQFVEAFEREARIVAALHHPAIVRIFDVGVATLEVCVVDMCEPGSDDGEDGLFQATAPQITAGEGEVVRQSVVATSTDRLGNTTVDTREVKIDNAAPVVTVTKSPDTAWANGDVTVTVNATDVGSGLGTVCITTDSSPCVPVPLDEFDANGDFLVEDIDVTGDGTATITVNATDNAGNQADETSADIDIDNHFGTPPAVNIE